MSWQLVSFLILGAVLLGGFAWYERSRPPAQVVALVAALAALAIAGRIAFAAFPNVKPTTDIIIFAGYALGPAAGFAVGALSALISNFWFGQGPWTPWQMAAWGLCGIFGAALALGTRNVGRLPLAAFCGLAAVGYGAILNFSLAASYGTEVSWAYFWVLEGRAVPFEFAHAAGNVAFALVAGPAMIRMLTRFRERFEWRRVEDAAMVAPGDPTPPAAGVAGTGRLAAVLLAVLLLGAFASTHARAAGTGGTDSAAAWLESVQNDDGGFGDSPGAKSDQAMTGWAMLGLEASGVNPQDVGSTGDSPVDYLQGAIASVQSPGDLARTILALEGAGVEPREFGGRNLVAALLAKKRDDGSYEGWPSSTAYAVLALRAAGIANVGDSVEWLRGAQNDDGGWGDIGGAPSNPDGTGAVLQVLTPSSQAAKRAVGYLRQSQQKGGGFRLGGNGALNTQSTAWAVEGLLAAGANPAQFRRGGRSAYEYLEANQAPDGHYRYSSKSDQTPIWVTGQVLVAASKQHLPLAAVPRAPQPQPKSTPVPAPEPTPTPTPVPTPIPETSPPPLPEASGGGITPSPGSSSGSGVGPGSAVTGPRSQGKGAPNGSAMNGSRANRGKGGPGAAPGSTPTIEAPGAGDEVLEIPPAGESEAGGGSTTVGTPAEPSDSGSDGSVLGSIVAGLIVGGLLFAIGFGPVRRRQAVRAGRARGGPARGPTPPASPAPPAAAPVGPGGTGVGGDAPGVDFDPPAINASTRPLPPPPAPSPRSS